MKRLCFLRLAVMLLVTVFSAAAQGFLSETMPLWQIGSDSLRRGEFLLAAQGSWWGEVCKPDSLNLKIIIIPVRVTSASGQDGSLEVTLADKPYPDYLIYGRSFYKTVIRVPDSVTVVEDSIMFYQPFELPDPARFWICLKNCGTDTLFFWSVSDGLPCFIQRNETVRPGSEIDTVQLAFRCQAVMTQVKNSREAVPLKIQLRQNYPNPFNAVTNISYFLPQTAPVRLVIFNTRGQQVAAFFNDQSQLSGRHDIQLDGNFLPSGVYLVILTTSFDQQVIKILLVK